MAYTDYSAHFVYKQLLTYQEMNQLGANDEYFKTGDPSVSGDWTFSGVIVRFPLKNYTYAEIAALSSPQEGEMAYCSDDKMVYKYTGSEWVPIG